MRLNCKEGLRWRRRNDFGRKRGPGRAIWRAAHSEKSNADNGPPVCIIGWSWLPRESVSEGALTLCAERVLTLCRLPAPRILLPANNSDGVFWASQLAKCMRARRPRKRFMPAASMWPTQCLRRLSARGSKYPPLFVLLAREHIFRFCSLSAFYSNNQPSRRPRTFCTLPENMRFCVTLSCFLNGGSAKSSYMRLCRWMRKMLCWDLRRPTPYRSNFIWCAKNHCLINEGKVPAILFHGLRHLNVWMNNFNIDQRDTHKKLLFFYEALNMVFDKIKINVFAEKL